MSYDRLTPTVSSKAKKLFGFGDMGQNKGGGAVNTGYDTDLLLCEPRSSLCKRQDSGAARNFRQELRQSVAFLSVHSRSAALPSRPYNQKKRHDMSYRLND